MSINKQSIWGMNIEAWKAYFTLQMLKILMLGFSSGMILPISLGTLSAHLWDNQLDLQAIGLFSAVALPYSFKFLWAPFIDNINIPILTKLMGKRRSWLIIIQPIIMVLIALCGQINPQNDPWFLAMMISFTVFFSATQDIIVDAFRIELSNDRDQAMTATVQILGYRIGMLATSAGALYIAHILSWEIAFFYMSALMSIGIIATLWLKEDQTQTSTPKHQNILIWVKTAFLEPLEDFFQRKHPVLILVMVVGYKLGDAFLGVMTTPFLLDTGFTKLELATYVKSYGFFASMFGTILGGYMVKTQGYARSLIVGLIVQTLSNLVFIFQYYAGHNVSALVLTITVENITGGIGTAALVGYVSHLCSKQFTATQYALLSSLDSMARVMLPTTSGFAAVYFGWVAFFIISAILNIPALIMACEIFRRQFKMEEYHEDKLQQSN
ncbi:MAG: AmpG family muropeptide MFS transporter [Proteobacteria bacterium]|nr:AmpG family muropeptide MFS transporter [Pseudomonadota bacterium]